MNHLLGTLKLSILATLWNRNTLKFHSSKKKNLKLQHLQEINVVRYNNSNYFFLVLGNLRTIFF